MSKHYLVCFENKFMGTITGPYRLHDLETARQIAQDYCTPSKDGLVFELVDMYSKKKDKKK